MIRIDTYGWELKNMFYAKIPQSPETGPAG